MLYWPSILTLKVIYETNIPAKKQETKDNSRL